MLLSVIYSYSIPPKSFAQFSNYPLSTQSWVKALNVLVAFNRDWNLTNNEITNSDIAYNGITHNEITYNYISLSWQHLQGH
jgi:hypothetical protein